MSTTGTQAIDRAAQLLTLVVQSEDPISFTELVEDSGLTRSTTSRLLAALEANHLLERHSDGGFSAGALFTHYASKHDGVMQLARIAEPVLREVGAETGETVNLGVARGDTVVQIAQVDSTFVLGARDWVGVDVPPHCSALGKVLYAFDALDVPSGPTRAADRTLPRLRSSAAQAAAHDPARRIRATTRDELEIGLVGGGRTRARRRTARPSPRSACPARPAASSRSSPNSAGCSPSTRCAGAVASRIHPRNAHGRRGLT